MKTDVKICGLTRSEDVEFAIKHGAALLGFIVEAASKRRLNASEAAKISAPAKGITPRVAVTVNANDSLLTRIMAEMSPEFIQCHGDESPARVAEIARRFKVRTIKAVGVACESDIKSSEEFVGVCDFILYDAKPPKGPQGQENAVRGGHGVSVDWTLMGRSPRPKTFALAGGLHSGNVARAIAQTLAPIVDVSSGVESAAGIKDEAKIHAFMKAVKNGPNR